MSTIFINVVVIGQASKQLSDNTFGLFIVLVVVIIVYLYFNNPSKHHKALKEKQEKEQQKVDITLPKLEIIRQIKEVQNKTVLEESTIRKFEQLNKQQFQNKFTIYRNDFLKKNITAFYHSDYHSGGNWKIDGTIENMIWTLKNDSSPFPSRLSRAKQQLENILLKDLPLILNSTNLNSLTLCVVPRAKKKSYYRNDQLFFHNIILEVVNKLNGFCNGTSYILRHTDTITTHLSKGLSGGGNGNAPYPGITNDTCTISNEVRGKDILLIDDLYTKSINIDEDAIQALLDKGANSVVFYAVGKTALRNQ